MDVGMPDLNGIEATRRITAKFPKIKVLALSMHADKRFVFHMFKAGARGYLLKDCAFEELVGAIRTLMQGKAYVSPNIAHLIVKDFVKKSSEADSSVFTILTEREREVLQYIAEGKSTKEIAYELKLSIKTIETHRQQIMDKLQLHSIAELTKYALRQGLTTLE